MREWQDKYYAEVGKPCGLARLGPARSRMPRPEWKKTQKLSEQLAELTNDVAKLADVKNEIENLYGEVNRLRLIEEKHEALQDENEALRRTLSDLSAKHELDLKVMREDAIKEISALQEELDHYAPTLKR
jgi:uncharacterized phage infection (PIP) family protein YhgE